MASLGLQNGPYALTMAAIDQYVIRTGPGNYALGHVKNGVFHVQYVGRSDSDVKQRLKDHSAAGASAQFKFAYATSPKAAFERECEELSRLWGRQEQPPSRSSQ